MLGLFLRLFEHLQVYCAHLLHHGDELVILKRTHIKGRDGAVSKGFAEEFVTP
jgi:hypothetical protein